MIIISDCLTGKIDEGCLKVANSLTKRIKQNSPNTTIISYDRKPEYSDKHFRLNKLFLNKKLIKIVREKKEPVLYIPFASNTMGSCLRIFVLSLFSGKSVNVLFALRFPMKSFGKTLLKLSKGKIIALSEASYLFYKDIVGNRAVYLKAGIDMKKFVPVTLEEKNALKRKYKIPEKKKVVLHVGHLKSGRNVDKLTYIGDEYQVVLVVSSVTEKDIILQRQLKERNNVTIISSYLKNIQEVYQMADVYLFPVQKEENCIDIPLSVLEAAACNLPVVTTEYGELKAFKGCKGFLFIDNLSRDSLNRAIDVMISKDLTESREAVREYDWKQAIETLQAIL